MAVTAALRVAERHILEGFAVQCDPRNDSLEIGKTRQARCGCGEERRVGGRTRWWIGHGVKRQSLLLGAGFCNQFKRGQGHLHIFFHVIIENVGEHFPVDWVAHQLQVEAVIPHLDGSSSVRRPGGMAVIVICTRSVAVAMIIGRLRLGSRRRRLVATSEDQDRTCG